MIFLRRYREAVDVTDAKANSRQHITSQITSFLPGRMRHDVVEHGLIIILHPAFRLCQHPRENLRHLGHRKNVVLRPEHTHTVVLEEIHPLVNRPVAKSQMVR